MANRDAGDWIAANLPADAVLASWDAGVVGYFSDRSVINLDGVVNSYEWHRASETGGTAAFLQEDGLGWIVNHGADVSGRDPAIDAFISSQFGASALDGSADRELVAVRVLGYHHGIGRHRCTRRRAPSRLPLPPSSTLNP